MPCGCWKLNLVHCFHSRQAEASRYFWVQCQPGLHEYQVSQDCIMRPYLTVKKTLKKFYFYYLCMCSICVVYGCVCAWGEVRGQHLFSSSIVSPLFFKIISSVNLALIICRVPEISLFRSPYLLWNTRVTNACHYSQILCGC